MNLNPLTLVRRAADWLNEKPESQWTLGEFVAKSKIGQALHIPSCTLPMSRWARFCERACFVENMIIAAPLIIAHPPLAIPILLSTKLRSTILGGFFWGCTKFASFTLGVFDQVVNGLDEYREGEKHARNMKKLRKQMAKGQQLQAALPDGPIFREADEKPGLVDRLIALGRVFNGRAGQQPGGFIPQQGPVGGQDPLGPAIWGSPTPSTTNQYEQPFQIPDVNTVRIASEGRESVQQHNLHYGPQPGHHHNNPNCN